MEKEKHGKQYSESSRLLPQEERLAVASKKSQFTIGIPKETVFQEMRVSLVPSSIAVLVQNGNRVVIQRGAGNSAIFPDHLYSEAGAEIVETENEIYQSDIIVKVAPPTIQEINMMKNRCILISALHLRGQNSQYFKALSEKRITAISYEHIQDLNGAHPLMQSISEIVGGTSVLLGAEYLSHPQWGRGEMLGGYSGICPSEVVILGAGTVGEYAAKAAIGLGAVVKVFDNNILRLRKLQDHIQTRVFTSILQADILAKSLKSADLVIAALYAPNGNSVVIGTEQMVMDMKKGSVIIDISIDRGGCFETSKETNHLNPVYQVHGVTHYCVPNVASRTPHTSSYALNNYFAPLLLEISQIGNLNELLISQPGLRRGVYMYNGKVTLEYVARKFNLPFQNIGLLLAAMG